jgi:hypothetical protein
MNVTAQYVGFTSKAIVREYNFLVEGVIDRAPGGYFYDSKRSIHVPPFEFPECPGHLLA